MKQNNGWHFLKSLFVRGQGSAFGHVVVYQVQSDPRTMTSSSMTLHCAEVKEVARGGQLQCAFMEWQWWSAWPLTSACSHTGKQTSALFQWALNHQGQLVVFQFIQWNWTLTWWSRLVSTAVKSHPSQAETTRAENSFNMSVNKNNRFLILLRNLGVNNLTIRCLEGFLY